ncbi:MAG: flavodoxin family protein [Dehalococcoidia bacterium]
MNVLVTYFSQTGNTRKVAEAIFETIEGEKDIREFSNVDSLDDYGLTFVGFPMQAFGPAQQAKEFLANFCQGKEIALFLTHGVTEDFEELPRWLENCRQAADGAEVVGMFDCQGEVAEFLLDAARESDDPLMQKLAGAGEEGKGQPDAKSLDEARAFAVDIMARYA